MNFSQSTRRCLAAGLMVGFSSVLFSGQKTDSATPEVPASVVVENKSAERASAQAKLATAEQEVRELRKQLQEERQKSDKTKPATDAVIAERVLKREKLLAKQREVSALRSQAEDPAVRAERHAFQDQLAAATTREERQVILDRHIALQSVLAEDKASTTANR